MAEPIPVPLGIALTLISAGVCAFIVFALVHESKRRASLFRDGVEAPGRIVRVESESSPGRYGQTWFPVVEFQANGATHQFRDLKGGREPDFAVGTEVRVLYDARNPSDALITGGRAMGPAGAILASLFGLAALGIGYLTISAL